MRSENIGNLVMALSKAQASFQPIKKNKVATIHTKKGGYNYRYAQLSDIFEAVKPALADNELAIIQTVDENEHGSVLITTLGHSSGEFISSYKTLGKFADPQQFGSALTYYRRYTAEGILGISSEDDDDGQHAKLRQRTHQAQTQPDKSNLHPAAKSNSPIVANSPEKLLNLLNRRVEVPFNHATHLFNAIKKQLDLEKYEWPRPNDANGWENAYKAAKVYAEKKTTLPDQPALDELDEHFGVSENASGFAYAQ